MIAMRLRGKDLRLCTYIKLIRLSCSEAATHLPQSKIEEPSDVRSLKGP